MPGGNLIQQQQQTDLRGFLGRRRVTLQEWMKVNNIIDAEGLGRLITDSKWYVDTELLSEAQSLLKSHTEAPRETPVPVEEKVVEAPVEEKVEVVTPTTNQVKRKKGV